MRCLNAIISKHLLIQYLIFSIVLFIPITDCITDTYTATVDATNSNAVVQNYLSGNNIFDSLYSTLNQTGTRYLGGALFLAGGLFALRGLPTLQRSLFGVKHAFTDLLPKPKLRRENQAKKKIITYNYDFDYYDRYDEHGLDRGQVEKTDHVGNVPGPPYRVPKQILIQIKKPPKSVLKPVVNTITSAIKSQYTSASTDAAKRRQDDAYDDYNYDNYVIYDNNVIYNNNDLYDYPEDFPEYSNLVNKKGNSFDYVDIVNPVYVKDSAIEYYDDEDEDHAPYNQKINFNYNNYNSIYSNEEVQKHESQPNNNRRIVDDEFEVIDMPLDPTKKTYYSEDYLKGYRDGVSNSMWNGDYYSNIDYQNGYYDGVDSADTMKHLKKPLFKNQNSYSDKDFVIPAYKVKKKIYTGKRKKKKVPTSEKDYFFDFLSKYY